MSLNKKYNYATAILPAPHNPSKLSSEQYPSEHDNNYSYYPELINHRHNKYGRYYSEQPLNFK